MSIPRESGGTRRSLRGYQLPSFNTYIGSLERNDDLNHPRNPLSGEQDNIIHTLRDQLSMRDQTIATLQVENARMQDLCNHLNAKSQIMDSELASLLENG